MTGADDESREAVRAFVNNMIRWESVRLDIQAERADDHHWPPPPNTVHPGFEDQAASVRQFMAAGHHQVVLPKSRRLLLSLVESDADIRSWDTTTLTVHRVWAPAPYVGDPFVYVWPVAVDRAKRWVAGEAHAQWLPQWIDMEAT